MTLKVKHWNLIHCITRRASQPGDVITVFLQLPAGFSLSTRALEVGNAKVQISQNHQDGESSRGKLTLVWRAGGQEPRDLLCGGSFTGH